MSINQRFDVVFMAPADGATQIVFSMKIVSLSL